MNYMIKLSATLLLIIVTCITLHGRIAPLTQTQTGDFKGTVIDMNGKKIRGAIVTVKSSELKRQLKSNSSGEFSIHLPIGTYEIMVEQSGFLSLRLINVTVIMGAKISYTFQLEPAHNLQTYSQTARLDGKVDGIIVNSVCEPMPNSRIKLKNRRWEQIITPNQSGHFIVDVPADDYVITVTSAKPQAFNIWRGRNGKLYLWVDTGVECYHCCSFEDLEDRLIPVEPVILNTEIQLRKPHPKP